MANLKATCKQCKLRLLKSEMIKVNLAYFCCFDHAVEFGKSKARVEKEKAFKKETARMRSNYNKSDLKIRKAAAKKACHDYIKARDAGQPCICCGEPMTGQIHAGHWLESGNHPFIRYHEDNIHSQRAYCNTYKGGDSDDYEGRLRLKIGNERVEWLIAHKSDPVKRTVQDYIEIETHYKEKLKELNSEAARYIDSNGEDWIDEFAKTATVDEFRGAMKFTIGKYLRRIGKKDDLALELEKIADYSNRWAEYEIKLIKEESY